MTEQAAYDFDVFISYSHADGDWVRNWLVVRLKREGLTVCLDGDDFDIGVPSLRNMENAIATSRYTVLVLTPAWEGSQFTNFEALLLQGQDPSGLYQRTLPVLRGPCDVPRRIAMLTYADFSGATDDEVELRKLLGALRGIRRLRDVERIPIGGSQSSTSTEPLPANGTNSRLFGEGLKAVYDLLLSEPEVRAAAASYRADFQAACEQIDILADYKDIHDLLHELHFKCFNPIVRETKHRSDREMERESLMIYALTLQDVIDQLREIARRKLLPCTETAWIEKDLVPAHDALRRAIDAADVGQLAKVIWLMNRVLAIQPSQINTRLNATSRALRLAALLRAMTRVWDSLSRIGADREKLRRFGDGVLALAKLNDSLSVLTTNHDEWQELDIELQRIEENLERDTVELEWSWPRLKEMTEPLCSGREDSWAQALQHESEKLERAMAARDTVGLVLSFQSFRTQVGQRFYRVDRALKGLCEELRNVGTPLAAVLEVAA